LRVDDRRIDVGEDLEFARAADVVAVARRAVGNDLVPVRLPHMAGLERLDHPGRLRHPANPFIRFDHSGTLLVECSFFVQWGDGLDAVTGARGAGPKGWDRRRYLVTCFGPRCSETCR